MDKRSLRKPSWTASKQAYIGGKEGTETLLANFIGATIGVLSWAIEYPGIKALTISTSNMTLNLVIALLSFLIRVVSDAVELRLTFGGIVILIFTLAIRVGITLLHTYPTDVTTQKTTVSSRVG
jgi:hypothetical protein